MSHKDDETKVEVALGKVCGDVVPGCCGVVSDKLHIVMFVVAAVSFRVFLNVVDTW